MAADPALVTELRKRAAAGDTEAADGLRQAGLGVDMSRDEILGELRNRADAGDHEALIALRPHGYSEAAGVVMTAADGATMGANDEIQGGIFAAPAAIAAGTGSLLNRDNARLPLLDRLKKAWGDAVATGRTVQQGITQRTRESVDQFARERPGAALATELVAGAVPTLASGGGSTVARAARYVDRPIMGFIRGALGATRDAAGWGGAYTFNSGRDMAERTDPGRLATGMAATGALGLVGHTAGGLIGHTGGDIMGVLARSGLDPRQRAVRLLASAIERGEATADDLVARGMRRSDAVRLIDSGRAPASTPDDLVKRSDQLPPQGGEVSETVAEMSPALSSAARGVQTVPGTGRNIINNRLTTRREGMAGRLSTAAETAFHTEQPRVPGEAADFLSNLKRARSSQARENYLNAHTAPVNPETSRTALIEPMAQDIQASSTSARSIGDAAEAGRTILGNEIPQWEAEAVKAEKAGAPDAAQRRLRVQNARSADEHLRQIQSHTEAVSKAKDATNAARAANDEAATWEKDLADMQADPGHDPTALQRLDTMTQRVRSEANTLAETADRATRRASVTPLPKELNGVSIDYMQRGLSQAEGKAGASTPVERSATLRRGAFNDHAEPAAPGLGEIRRLYGSSKKAEEAFQEGLKLDANPENIENLIERYKGINERDGLLNGIMELFDKKLDTNDAAFVFRLMRNKRLQDAFVRAARTPKDGKILRNRIVREAGMRWFENFIMGGSQTAPRLEDVKALTEGEAELSWIADMVHSRGRIDHALLRWAARMWARENRNGINDPDVAREMASILMQKASHANTSALRAEIEALPTLAAASAKFGQRGGRYGAKFTAGALSIPARGVTRPPEDLSRRGQ